MTTFKISLKVTQNSPNQSQIHTGSMLNFWIMWSQFLDSGIQSHFLQMKAAPFAKEVIFLDVLIMITFAHIIFTEVGVLRKETHLKFKKKGN